MITQRRSKRVHSNNDATTIRKRDSYDDDSMPYNQKSPQRLEDLMIQWLDVGRQIAADRTENYLDPVNVLSRAPAD